MFLFIHVQCLTIRCTMSPDLFGTPGKASSKLYFSQLLHLCIRWLVQLLVGGGSCIHTTHMECNTSNAKPLANCNYSFLTMFVKLWGFHVHFAGIPPSIASQVSGVLAKCLPKSSRPLCFTKVSTTPQ